MGRCRAQLVILYIGLGRIIPIPVIPHGMEQVSGSNTGAVLPIGRPVQLMPSVFVRGIKRPNGSCAPNGAYKRPFRRAVAPVNRYYICPFVNLQPVIPCRMDLFLINRKNRGRKHKAKHYRKYNFISFHLILHLVYSAHGKTYMLYINSLQFAYILPNIHSPTG